MRIKNISLLVVMALAVYYGFDLYIGWLIINYPIGTILPALYFPMILTNVLGIYVYHLIGRDFLEIESAKMWLAREDGRFSMTRKILRKSKILSFLVLSIFPCPMAGYYLLKNEDKKTIFSVLGIISIGSFPCTLVWGGGLIAIWNIVKLLFF